MFILVGVVGVRENKSALMTAANLLLRQEQSSKNLRRKLSAKKFSESEIDSAIETLQERNYLNDAETCRQQFENLYSAEKLSAKQICMKLIQRGFDSEFVKNLVPENYEEREKKIATRLLEKSFRTTNFENLDAKEKYKLKNKMYQKLYMKGFESEVIAQAIENFFVI